MAISPKCDKCGDELRDFGAILLSPPMHNKVIKYHICKTCYIDLSKDLLKPEEY